MKYLKIQGPNRIKYKEPIKLKEPQELMELNEPITVACEGYDGKSGNGCQWYNEDGTAHDTSNTADVFNLNAIYLINKYLYNMNSVLDIGCGNGRFSFILANIFKQVIAIDNQAKYSDIFKKDNIEFISIDFNEYNCKNNFDLLMFWGSFYIMPNYMKALSHCRKMMGSNSFLIITDSVHRNINLTETPAPVCYDLSDLLIKNRLQLIEIKNCNEVFTTYIIKAI